MHENLNISIGALLIGTLLTAIGFGITIMQMYLWYHTFPNDSRIIRYVVWSIFCLDVCHIILTIHVIYHYLVINFNNPDALAKSVWSFDATIVVTAVITCIAHAFYSRRIYILSDHNRFFPVAVATLSIVRLVFGCIVTAEMLRIKVLAGLTQRIGVLVGTGMGAGSLADWIITASLVFYLRRKRTGFSRRTDSLINRLTYWTINNGLLTSVLGLAVIITLVTMPYNMIYLALHLLLSKLYSNSLLATLNYRRVHSGRGINDSGEEAVSIPLSSRVTGVDSSLPYTVKDTDVAVPAVHVTTTIISDAARADSLDGAKSYKHGCTDEVQSVECDEV